MSLGHPVLFILKRLPCGFLGGFAGAPMEGGKPYEMRLSMLLHRAAIPTNPISTYMPSFETAARSLKVMPITAPVHKAASGL